MTTGGSAAEGSPAQIAFRAMGCTASAALHAADAARWLAEVGAWFRGWERALSRFSPESELSGLNRAGATVEVSQELWLALEAALEAARWTDGIVTPTVLPSLEVAGYDRSFELLGDGPEATAPAGAAVGDWRSVALDPGTHSVRLGIGTRLDLGGTAKGWAVDRALARLAPRGPALVEAGGDLAVSAPQPGGAPWPIAVASPVVRDGVLGLLLVTSGGVATSGRDHRRWMRGGQELHHLIDPRTGRPAVTDVVSSTVVGPSAWAAEAAAKVVLIRGSRAGLDWLEAQPGFAGLAVLEGGELRATPGLAMRPPP